MLRKIKKKFSVIDIILLLSKLYKIKINIFFLTFKKKTLGFAYKYLLKRV